MHVQDPSSSILIERLVVVQAGRFQPPHPGHLATWRHLAERFGETAVFLGTSDKHDPPSAPSRHPFTFAEKVALISALSDIPASQVVQLRVPYQPRELLERFPAERTALVVAVSERDPDRLSKGSYFRPLPEDTSAPLLPYPEAGYVTITPLFAGGLSATALRARLADPSEDRAAKRRWLRALYGRDAPEAASLLLDRLSP